MIPLLFSVLLLAADTSGASAAAATDGTEQASPAKKEKKICRVDPANTGSRMARRLCLTQVEWDKRASGKSVGDLKTMGAR